MATAPIYQGFKAKGQLKKDYYFERQSSYSVANTIIAPVTLKKGQTYSFTFYAYNDGIIGAVKYSPDDNSFYSPIDIGDLIADLSKIKLVKADGTITAISPKSNNAVTYFPEQDRRPQIEQIPSLIISKYILTKDYDSGQKSFSNRAINKIAKQFKKGDIVEAMIVNDNGVKYIITKDNYDITEAAKLLDEKLETKNITKTIFTKTNIIIGVAAIVLVVVFVAYKKGFFKPKTNSLTKHF